MDRRSSILAAAALLLALLVAVVVITDGDEGGEEIAAADEADKPSVEVPDGPPPESLEVTDIEAGDGEEATSGDTVTVNYVGVLYENGEEFDTSWGREPLELELGAGEVIPGWDQGLEGMRVGGRRQLVIPPDLAYGEQGSPPDIPGDATLVFLVDLLAVE